MLLSRQCWSGYEWILIVFSILFTSGIFDELKVDHSYLVSPYHAGMVAAFVLIARNLEHWLASKHEV